MAVIESWFNQDLKEPVKVRYLDGNIFSADNSGNLIGVNVFDDGEPASLSGSVSASVIRADGNTVAVTGTLSGNQVSIVLPQAAYAVPGVISIVIKLTSGTDITTLCAVVANVYMSTTDTVVDPGTIIPSVETLIAAIDAAIASVPADYSTLLAAIASNYSSSKTYPIVGTYAWYNGVLKRSIVPITTAESYNAAHWTDAIIGDDVSALKSAFNGANNIEVVSFVKNHFITTKNTTVNPDSMTANADYDCAVVSCSPGDVFTIKGKGGGSPRLWCFISDATTDNQLSVANQNKTLNCETIIAPENATKLVLNVDHSMDAFAVKGLTPDNRMKEMISGVITPMNSAEAWSAYNADVNNLPVNSIVQITYIENIANLPVSNFYGTIMTYDYKYNANTSASSVTQIAIDNYSKVYTRIRWGSTWREWKKIPVIDNVLSSNMESINSATAWATYSNDMDNLEVNKVYQIVYNKDSSDNPIAHLPVVGFFGNVITFDYLPTASSKTIVQLAFAKSGKTYRRMMWGQTWGSWYEFANMEDIPNVGTAYKGLGDFIACGDSNTVSLSYPTADHGIPVKSWATSFAEMIGSECDIYAAGGRSTAGFINSDDYAPAIADTKQFAILYLGINDCSQSVDIETFTENYTTIVNALLTNHKFVFCLNIPKAVQPSSRRTQYNTAIASVCSSVTKAFLVDITGCSDRIAVYKNVGHLSSIGYSVLAGEIAQAINKTMSENDYFDAQIDVDSN
ncbi:MAG: hypothetical protein IIZ93_13805 [Acidaminococcaceae bacterium]|nr:hypothetical protein [Acidaminococcaceae bacterium]